MGFDDYVNEEAASIQAKQLEQRNTNDWERQQAADQAPAAVALLPDMHKAIAVFRRFPTDGKGLLYRFESTFYNASFAEATEFTDWPNKRWYERKRKTPAHWLIWYSRSGIEKHLRNGESKTNNYSISISSTDEKLRINRGERRMTVDEAAQLGSFQFEPHVSLPVSEFFDETMKIIAKLAVQNDLVK